MKEFFQEILDIHDNWTAIIGCIDIVHFNDEFAIKNGFINKNKINPLSNEVTNEDFYIIIGKGQSEMIIDALLSIILKLTEKDFMRLRHF